MTEPKVRRAKISGSRHTAELAIVLRALHALQHRNGGVPPTISEIAEEAAMDAHIARLRLSRLVDYGLIERRSWTGFRVFQVKNGAWRQPPEPLPPLESETEDAPRGV